MFKSIGACAAGLAFACAAHSAHAATLIPVAPVADSTSSSIIGINNHNQIVGSWFDADDVEHGYFGTLAGAYTSFDYPGDAITGTEARGLNDDGLIIGFAIDGSGTFAVGPQFIYDPASATFTTITKHGKPLDGIAQGFNNKGRIAGNYYQADFSNHGYTGKVGHWSQDLTVFGSTSVRPRAMNNKGVVGGFFYLEGTTHGFLVNQGVATQVDFPGAKATFVEGINDKGLAAGFWNDEAGALYAFTFDSTTGQYASIEVPGATRTQAFGINNNGLIAVSSDVGSFVYCPRKAAKCPAGPSGASAARSGAKAVAN